MEKKDNVEKGVSEKPEAKKSAAYYEKRPEFVTEDHQRFCCISGRGLPFFL